MSSIYKDSNDSLKSIVYVAEMFSVNSSISGTEQRCTHRENLIQKAHVQTSPWHSHTLTPYQFTLNNVNASAILVRIPTKKEGALRRTQ